MNFVWSTLRKKLLEKANELTERQQQIQKQSDSQFHFFFKFQTINTVQTQNFAFLLSFILTGTLKSFLVADVVFFLRRFLSWFYFV